MIDDPNLDRMPGWRRCLLSFNEAGYKPGDAVAVAWLENELGVTYPKTGSAEEFEAARLRWLHEFGRFHERLRDDRQLFLRRDGECYQVLTASEQLAYAQAEGRRRVKNALRWQADALASTNVNALTDAERAQHADAMARLARARSFTREMLPPPKKDGEK